MTSSGGGGVLEILVTGGAGFIGSHVVDKLINNNKKVIVVDNLSKGRKENINSEAIFYNLDICDLEKLKDVFKQHNIKYVFHLAAQTNAMASNCEPVMDCNSNVLGTVNILELCKQFDIEKIIFSSTAAVYGEPITNGIDEEHITSPKCFYGVSKLSGEKYFELFYDLFGLNYTIMRYSNVYGPRQTAMGEGGVVAVFLDNLLNNQNPVIYGDCFQTRDFIYVEDIVEANIQAMNSNFVGTVNISTGTECTINDLYLKMSDMLNKKIPPIYKEMRKGDILRSYLLNSKAKKQLGWEDKYSLETGLQNLIDHSK